MCIEVVVMRLQALNRRWMRLCRMVVHLYLATIYTYIRRMCAFSLSMQYINYKRKMCCICFHPSLSMLLRMAYVYGIVKLCSHYFFYVCYLDIILQEH